MYCTGCHTQYLSLNLLKFVPYKRYFLYYTFTTSNLLFTLNVQFLNIVKESRRCVKNKKEAFEFIGLSLKTKIITGNLI